MGSGKLGADPALPSPRCQLTSARAFAPTHSHEVTPRCPVPRRLRALSFMPEAISMLGRFGSDAAPGTLVPRLGPIGAARLTESLGN